MTFPPDLLEFLHKKSVKLRQKKCMTKRCMFGASNLRQSKKQKNTLVVMVETFRMSCGILLLLMGIQCLLLGAQLNTNMCICPGT